MNNGLLSLSQKLLLQKLLPHILQRLPYPCGQWLPGQMLRMVPHR